MRQATFDVQQQRSVHAHFLCRHLLAACRTPVAISRPAQSSRAGVLLEREESRSGDSGPVAPGPAQAGLGRLAIVNLAV
jgi:hypothetical protein